MMLERNLFKIKSIFSIKFDDLTAFQGFKFTENEVGNYIEYLTHICEGFGENW